MGFIQDLGHYVEKLTTDNGKTNHQKHYAATAQNRANDFYRASGNILSDSNTPGFNRFQTATAPVVGTQAYYQAVESAYAAQSGVIKTLESVFSTIPGFTYHMTANEMQQVAHVIANCFDDNDQTKLDREKLTPYLSKVTGYVEKAVVGIAAEFEAGNRMTNGTGVPYTPAADIIDSIYGLRNDAGKNGWDIIRPSRTGLSLLGLGATFVGGGIAAASAAGVMSAGGIAAGTLVAAPTSLAYYGTSRVVGFGVAGGLYGIGAGLERAGVNQGTVNAVRSAGTLAMYGTNLSWMSLGLIAPLAMKFGGEYILSRDSESNLGKGLSVIADYIQPVVLGASTYSRMSNDFGGKPLFSGWGKDKTDAPKIGEGQPQSNGEIPQGETSTYTPLANGHVINVERAIAISPTDANKGILAATDDLNNNTWFPAFHQHNDSIIYLAQQDKNGLHIISNDYISLDPDSTHSFQTLTNDFGTALHHSTVSDQSVATWHVNTSMDIYDGTPDGIFTNVIPVIMGVNNEGAFTHTTTLDYTVPHLAVHYADQSGSNMFATNTVWDNGHLYQPFDITDVNAHAGVGQHPDGPQFVTGLTLFEHKSASENDLSILVGRSENIPEVVNTTTTGLVYCADTPRHNGYQVWPEDANAGFRLATGIPIKVWDNSYDPANSLHDPFTVRTWNGVFNFSSGEANYTTPEGLGHYWPSLTGITRTDQFRDYPFTWNELLQQMGVLNNFPALAQSLDPQHFAGNYNTERFVFCLSDVTSRHPPTFGQGGWNSGGGPGEPTDPPTPPPPGTTSFGPSAGGTTITP